MDYHLIMMSPRYDYAEIVVIEAEVMARHQGRRPRWLEVLEPLNIPYRGFIMIK